MPKLQVVCADCGCDMPSVEIDGNAHEVLRMLSICQNCYIPPEPPRNLESEMDLADIEILKMAVRGELLDADNKPVPAITCLQSVEGYTEITYNIKADELIELSKQFYTH